MLIGFWKTLITGRNNEDVICFAVLFSYFCVNLIINQN